MKLKTIKEIKAELATLDSLDHPDFSTFLQDSRSGVQMAVQQRKKQIQTERQEDSRLEALLLFEKELYSQGISLIAGIDEVGRGPLAGPVVAAAVILPENCKISGLNDSKKIPKAKHEQIYQAIVDKAIAIGIGSCSPEEIDRINIYQASRKAMTEAVSKLTPHPQHLLIDAMKLDLSISQTSLIKGDAKSMSIAAASIVAKVTRDQLMAEYAKKYPDYDFQHNAGYGTAKHLEALLRFGATPIHRKTFSPVTKILQES